MTPSTDQPLSYSSQSIPPGEVRIEREPDRVQISVGPLDGKAWIAALLPGIGSIMLCAVMFAFEVREDPGQVGDLAISLLGVGMGSWTLYRMISMHGRSRVITVDREHICVSWVGLADGKPTPISEMTRICARRIWWSPMIWALVAEGYPKWWRRRIGMPAAEKSDGVGTEVLLMGRREAVTEAAAALQVFVPGRSPPPVLRWVPWAVGGGMVFFGSLAVWAVRASLNSMGSTIWFSTLSIMAFFALPIGALVAIDKGRLRQHDGRPVHRNNAAEWVMVIALLPFVWLARAWKKLRGNKKTGPSGSAGGAVKKPVKRPVMIEGLPPRTMN